MTETLATLDEILLAAISKRKPGATRDDLNESLSDVGLDSLDIVDITHDVEDRFHIEVSSYDVSKLKTIPEIRRYLGGLIDGS
ncbi:phosphopantetheine-binding protein [Millisia brevis]|uniref:phosphopantetheine-binding protein n=1 Tax=Millisia brevis TaxID=264148 RepID=UPI000831F9A0|nr:phosphopantetheine-binding protein [Millisia brevis]